MSMRDQINIGCTKFQDFVVEFRRVRRYIFHDSERVPSDLINLIHVLQIRGSFSAANILDSLVLSLSQCSEAARNFQSTFIEKM